jgi:catechol 2,3-dioxygenase-like lactoylglutathione lyase family enzyme
MKQRVIQLDHVALHVADVGTSVGFYRDALGLEPMPRPAFDFPGAWFQLGPNQELHLIGDRADPVHSHNRGNHFAMLVDDVDYAEALLRERGVTILKRNIRPDGAPQVFIRDPDGHVIEFCGPPPQTAGPGGQ